MGSKEEELIVDGSLIDSLLNRSYTMRVVFVDSSSREIEHGATADQPSSLAVEEVNAAIAAEIVPQHLQSRYTSQITRAEYRALAVVLYEQYTGAEITQRMTFKDTYDLIRAN